MKMLILTCFLMLFTGCDKTGNESRAFNFTYSVELESSNNKKLELWLPIPKSNEVQIISNLIINADDLTYEIKDELIHGNKYLYVYDEQGTSNKKNVTMSFDVLRQEHNNVIYSAVNTNNYLSSYSMVPVGKMFKEIISNNSLNKTDMKSVYDFVLSGMHYGKPKSKDNIYYTDPWLNAETKYGKKKVTRDEVVSLYKYAKSTKGNYTFGNGNSMYACDIGVGNCTDYHSYFMSLARTLEVPARFHMGFPIPDDDEGVVKGYHCWADYYVDGEGWYPVDISEADKDPSKSEYFFGTACENRVEMMVGRDFILEGYENGNINLFIYPLLEINDKNSDAFSKNFSFKDID